MAPTSFPDTATASLQELLDKVTRLEGQLSRLLQQGEENTPEAERATRGRMAAEDFRRAVSMAKERGMYGVNGLLSALQYLAGPVFGGHDTNRVTRWEYDLSPGELAAVAGIFRRIADAIDAFNKARTDK